MLKKLHNNDGFVLLESLLALSVITFAVMIILPFSRSLLNTRRDRFMHIEGYRVMYDYTNQNIPNNTTSVNRSGQNYQVSKSMNSVKVTMPDKSVIEVRMK